MKLEGNSVGVKVLLVCPVPVEFLACRTTLFMQDIPLIAGCRSARVGIGVAELTALGTGAGHARAAAAVAAACCRCPADAVGPDCVRPDCVRPDCVRPDLVVDTGSCAGLGPGAGIGQVVLGTASCEYELRSQGGRGVSVEVLPTLKRPSALECLGAAARRGLKDEALEIGRRAGVIVRAGAQACAEVLVNSSELRRSLHRTLGAFGANWESSGVFAAASEGGVSALSLRVITDLGDSRALHDFRRHVKTGARRLYGYLGLLAETGWFGRFEEAWASRPGAAGG